MNKPIQDLYEEHSAIVQMLAIMEKFASRLKNGDNIKREYLEKIVEFLRIFADKCHHGKEENILFPELLKNPANEKAVNELLGEHKTGRDMIRGIAESVEKCSAGNPDAWHIAVNMHAYSQLLKEHIRKEGKLFPRVDKELSAEVQEEIEERFEKLEKEVIGEGVHEKYHSWLKELKEV